jgi:hypothetical protein
LAAAFAAAAIASAIGGKITHKFNQAVIWFGVAVVVGFVLIFLGGKGADTADTQDAHRTRAR